MRPSGALGGLHARTHCGAARGHRRCLGLSPRLGAGAGYQEADPDPTRLVRAELDPDRQQGTRHRGQEEFDKKQIELIQKVTAYFNQMTEIKGVFVQTSADNKRVRGKFYVKRPGKFRFDYSAAQPARDPVRRRVAAHPGHRHEDRERVELDRTPFRLLLRKDVDLLRDATYHGGQGGRTTSSCWPAGPEPR